jgi:hypothetical protein
VVVASIIDYIYKYTSPSDTNSASSTGSSVIKLIRIFRIVRILKLAKNMEGLQKLVFTIIFSIPSLLNVTSLLFLVYFIFSILGCFLFTDIQYTINDIRNPLTNFQVIGVNNYVGFNNFLISFITLFRISTGEDWYKIMFDTTRDASYRCI